LNVINPDESMFQTKGTSPSLTCATPAKYPPPKPKSVLPPSTGTRLTSLCAGSSSLSPESRGAVIGASSSPARFFEFNGSRAKADALKHIGSAMSGNARRTRRAKQVVTPFALHAACRYNPRRNSARDMPSA
jgi:hypothetical protein